MPRQPLHFASKDAAAADTPAKVPIITARPTAPLALLRALTRATRTTP